MSTPYEPQRWTSPLVAMAALIVILQSWLPSTSAMTRAAQDHEDLLRGTWLREYSEDGVQVHRVLALEADGNFHENVRVEEGSGHVTAYAHEGTWLYDGTNLKRRYTRVNGHRPSPLNAPFATVEVQFESDNDFVGVDHVHGHRIEYHRVASGTEP
jgi:hypothetical protein